VVLERFGLSLWFHGLLRQLNAASIDATRNNAMTTPTRINPLSMRSTLSAPCVFVASMLGDRSALECLGPPPWTPVPQAIRFGLDGSCSGFHPC
jgi:hypothetical protein